MYICIGSNKKTFFFFFFPTIFVLFLFLVTLRFYAGGGFPIVAVPGGCSLGGKASSTTTRISRPRHSLHHSFIIMR